MSDLKAIYLSHIRSILEQTCVIWHNYLTEENKNDMERVQKNAFRIILGKHYQSYNQSLKILNLETLFERRKGLSLNFAINNCIYNPKTKQLFPLNKKKHKLKTRKSNKYKIFFARTKRFKESTVPYLQRLLNNNFEMKKNSKIKQIKTNMKNKQF